MAQVSQNIMLLKYVAQATHLSRRQAVDVIKQGNVTVNGQVIREPWHQINVSDMVLCHKKKLTRAQRSIYIAYNKPIGAVTTRFDQHGRLTVMDHIGIAKRYKLVPIGRLDLQTTGLLLMTNDGDLVQKITHPKYQVSKKYAIFLDKPLQNRDREALLKGVRLPDGRASVDQIHSTSSAHQRKLVVTLHSGKYRIIRRLFGFLGYNVIKLDRIACAGISKRGIAVGQWRYLNAHEVSKLRQV